MDLKDELDHHLLNMLMDLEEFEGSSKDRSDMVDDFCKLYRVRLDEKKEDHDFDREMIDGLTELEEKKKALQDKEDEDERNRTNMIIGRCVDVGIALLKVGATVLGYCIAARMHANSIEADSYGVLQRSASFKVIPKVDPGRDL